MANVQFIKFDKIKFTLICLLILISDDTILFGTNSDSTFIIFKYLFIISSVVVLFFVEILNTIPFNLKQICYALIMFVCIIITMLFNDDYINGYVYLMFLICAAIVFTKFVRFAEFIFYFDKSMFWLACISLIAFFVYILNSSIFSSMPVVTNTAGLSFHTVVFSNLPDSTGVVRNFGAFREPGVYQVFLILSLIFQLFCFEELNIKHLVIYCVTVITTFSTTGYFALFFIVVCYIARKTNVTLKHKSIFLIIICVFLIMIDSVLFDDEIFELVFGKLFMEHSVSYTARVGGALANLNIWKEAPFFGNGLTVVSEQFSRQTYYFMGMGSEDNTNTYLFFLATFGCFFTGIFFWAYYKLISFITSTKMEKIILTMVLLIIFAGEKMAFSLIIWILCLYAVDGNDFKKIGKKIYG